MSPPRAAVRVTILSMLLIPSACADTDTAGAVRSSAGGGSVDGARDAAPSASDESAAAAAVGAGSPAGGSPQDASGARDDEPPGVELASIVGRVGFDWLHPERARCRKVSSNMVRRLARRRAVCTRHDESEGFAETGGDFVTCKAGNKEWMLYANRAVCEKALGAMEANAP